MTETFSFSTALVNLKEGARVARVGWNGVGMYLELQSPDETSKMKKPYIYIVPSEDGSFTIPWVASQTDLLSDDWFLVQ